MSEENPLASLSHERGEFRATSDGALEWTGRTETLRIQPWGRDSLRVRAKVGGPILEGLPGALLDEPSDAGVPVSAVAVGADEASIVNGAITATVSLTGRIRFSRSADGAELLAEQDAHFWWPGPRLRTAHGN